VPRPVAGDVSAAACPSATDGVKVEAAEPAPGTVTTANPAAGHDVAVGTDTGDFTTGTARGFSAPTRVAAAIFGNGGGPPETGDAIAGAAPMYDATNAATATAVPVSRNRKPTTGEQPAISTSRHAGARESEKYGAITSLRPNRRP